jgi:hypothetical protein
MLRNYILVCAIAFVFEGDVKVRYAERIKLRLSQYFEVVWR